MRPIVTRDIDKTQIAVYLSNFDLGELVDFMREEGAKLDSRGEHHRADHIAEMADKIDLFRKEAKLWS